MQNETFSHLVSFLYKNPEGNMMSFTYQPDREGAKVYLIPNEGRAGLPVGISTTETDENMSPTDDV